MAGIARVTMERLRKAVNVWRNCNIAQEQNIHLSDFLTLFLGEVLSNEDTFGASAYNQFVWSEAESRFYDARCACNCEMCPVATFDVNINSNERQLAFF